MLLTSKTNLVSIIPHKVDEFVSGSRRVGFGLLLAGILLSWTWSLTLLESAVKSYSMGFVGHTIMLLEDFSKFQFSVISSKIKNANLVTHSQKWGTFRFGVPGHLAFLWCGLCVMQSLAHVFFLEGSAVLHAVTGVSQYLHFS